MTEIEQKALVLLNKVQDEHGYVQSSRLYRRDRNVFSEALCRAIEQHEATKQELSAFRQEVSDIVHDYVHGAGKKGAIDAWEKLNSLIIPAPKPDPLLEALEAAGWLLAEEGAEAIRAALDARGLEIKEKGETK